MCKIILNLKIFCWLSFVCVLADLQEPWAHLPLKRPPIEGLYPQEESGILLYDPSTVPKDLLIFTEYNTDYSNQKELTKNRKTLM